MATPTIPNGEEYFFPIIYEGNGAGQRVGKFVPFTDNGTIDNSCIFNSADNANLSRTPSGAGNRKTFTISFWIKRAKLNTTNGQQILTSHTDTNNRFQMFFDASVGGGAVGNKLTCFDVSGGTTISLFETNRTFEDTSKFYHILLAFDTTQSTASDRMKLYVDGDQITSFNVINYPAQDYQLRWNINATHYIGRYGASTAYPLDAYLAEFNNVDGTALTPSTFGVTDTSTGRWIPKTLSGITYGTNGFRLKFQDSSALGDDTSGNTNDFTATNLASTDQTTDSPTQNFATGLGAFQTSYAMTMSEGNLKSAATGGSGQHGKSSSSLTFDANDSNGYYAEYTVNETSSVGSNFNAVAITVDREAYSVPDSSNGKVSGQVRYMEDGRFRTTNLAGTLTDISSWGSTWGDVSTPDIIGIFVKNNKIYFSKNGTWQNSANPDNETGGMDVKGTIGSNRVRFSHIGYGTSVHGTMTANFGQKSFTYTPPTGYKTLNQDNLPTTDKGVADLVWVKDRDGTLFHILYNSSRGARTFLYPNGTQQEQGENGSAFTTLVDGVQKFLKGGFSVEDQTNVNQSGNSFVSWNWTCNSGTTETNTDGSVTCDLQVNNTAKFSIQSWTNTGAGTKTIGHGLGVKPGVVIQKRRDTTSNWFFYHHSLSGAGSYLHLNTTDATQTGSDFANTEPTSSVFSSNASGLTSATFVSFCWAEVEGFSKFGSYTGNGNADGPVIYTGFKPAWIMMKNASDGDSFADWSIFDNARSPTNEVTAQLRANLSNAELTSNKIDMLSNGFKLRGTGTRINESGDSFIYMAFAEHPFVGDGTSPVTAR